MTEELTKRPVGSADVPTMTGTITLADPAKVALPAFARPALEGEGEEVVLPPLQQSPDAYLSTSTVRKTAHDQELERLRLRHDQEVAAKALEHAHLAERDRMQFERAAEQAKVAHEREKEARDDAHARRVEWVKTALAVLTILGVGIVYWGVDMPADKGRDLAVGGLLGMAATYLFKK